MDSQEQNEAGWASGTRVFLQLQDRMVQVRSEDVLACILRYFFLDQQHVLLASMC